MAKLSVSENERTLKFPWHKIGSDGIFYGLGYGLRLDTEKQISIIRPCSSDGEIRLQDSINNGDVWGIFIRGQYRILPVNKVVVLDVGSNIGDSSIYFALQGLSRVIAVDPIPYNYRIARENVNLNHFTNKIDVILAGCDSETHWVQIPCRENDILQDVLMELN